MVLSLDASGVFSNIDRTVLDQVCAAKCPIMREVLRQWYGLPGVKVWRSQGRFEEMMTETGVDQGDPTAAALFCIGLAQAIERLAAVDPEVHAAAYQDDVYLILRPESLDNIFAKCVELWAELGLTLNKRKLQVFTEDGGVRRSLPSTWADKCVHSMKLLGQKLSLRLEEEGVPLLLGEGDALEAAVTQLTKLQANLCRLTSAGLLAAVRHQLWLLASTGAVTHLMACTYFKPGQLGRLDALQRKHLEWIAQRPVDKLTTAIARLPLVRGGIGLSDFGQRGTCSIFGSAVQIAACYGNSS